MTKNTQKNQDKLWIVTEIKEWVDGSRTHETVSIRLNGDAAKAFAKRKNEQQDPRALQPLWYQVSGPFSIDE